MSFNPINQVVITKTTKEISIDTLIQLCNKFRDFGYKIVSLSKENIEDDSESESESETIETKLGLYNSSNTYGVNVSLVKSVTKIKENYSSKTTTEYWLCLTSSNKVPLNTLQKFQDTALDFIPV